MLICNLCCVCYESQISTKDGSYDMILYGFLDDTAGYVKEDWLSETSVYRDAEISEMKKNGDDRYIMATAVRDDYYGVPYAEKHVYYMHIAKEGVGVYWELEDAYGIDLSEYYYEKTN